MRELVWEEGANEWPGTDHVTSGPMIAQRDTHTHTHMHTHTHTHTHTQTDRQTDGHGNSMTELAQFSRFSENKWILLGSGVTTGRSVTKGATPYLFLLLF